MCLKILIESDCRLHLRQHDCNPFFISRGGSVRAAEKEQTMASTKIKIYISFRFFPFGFVSPTICRAIYSTHARRIKFTFRFAIIFRRMKTSIAKNCNNNKNNIPSFPTILSLRRPIPCEPLAAADRIYSIGCTIINSI